jgi:hypothetical protein
MPPTSKNWLSTLSDRTPGAITKSPVERSSLPWADWPASHRPLGAGQFDGGQRDRSASSTLVQITRSRAPLLGG